MNEADYRAVAERLGACRHPAITIHQNPDADTVGSALALFWACERLALRAQLVATVLPLPIECAFLPGADRFKTAASAKTDLLIAVDTATPKLLPPNLPDVDLIILDHHISNPGYGVINCIDPQAAATGVVVMDIIAALGVALTPPIATALYAAIASDSRFFTIDRTDSALFERAALLVRSGADPAAIGQGLKTRSLAQMRLLGHALTQMRLYCGGRVAVVLMDRALLEQTGAQSFDIADELLSAVTAEVAITIAQQPDGTLRGSLRSQNGHDVGAVAAQMGGGGHKAAGGFRSELSLEAAQDRLLAIIAPILGEDSDED